MFHVHGCRPFVIFPSTYGLGFFGGWLTCTRDDIFPRWVEPASLGEFASSSSSLETFTQLFIHQAQSKTGSTEDGYGYLLHMVAHFSSYPPFFSDATLETICDEIHPGRVEPASMTQRSSVNPIFPRCCPLICTGSCLFFCGHLVP